MNGLPENSELVQSNKVFSNKTLALKITALIILIYILSGIIFSIFESMITNEFLKKSFSIYSQGLLQILFILLPTLYFAGKAQLPAKTLLRLNTPINRNQAIAGVIGIFAFQIAASAFLILQEKVIPTPLMDSYKTLEELVEKIYTGLLGGNGIFDFSRALLIGAIIPAISEETLFRGYLQRSLEEEIPAKKAIIITSVIFAVLHLNPIGFIPLLGIGIYLGFVAWASQSLILPIILHFINNALAIIILYSSVLTNVEDEATKIPVLWAILILIFSSFILIYCINIILIEKRSKSSP